MPLHSNHSELFGEKLTLEFAHAVHQKNSPKVHRICQHLFPQKGELEFFFFIPRSFLSLAGETQEKNLSNSTRNFIPCVNFVFSLVLRERNFTFSAPFPSFPCSPPHHTVWSTCAGVSARRAFLIATARHHTTLQSPGSVCPACLLRRRRRRGGRKRRTTFIPPFASFLYVCCARSFVPVQEVKGGNNTELSRFKLLAKMWDGKCQQEMRFHAFI